MSSNEKNNQVNTCDLIPEKESITNNEKKSGKKLLFFDARCWIRTAATATKAKKKERPLNLTDINNRYITTLDSQL